MQPLRRKAVADVGRRAVLQPARPPCIINRNSVLVRHISKSQLLPSRVLRRPYSAVVQREESDAVCTSSNETDAVAKWAYACTPAHESELRRYLEPQLSTLSEASAFTALSEIKLREITSAQVIASTMVRQRDAPSAISALLERHAFDEDQRESIMEWLRHADLAASCETAGNYHINGRGGVWRIKLIASPIAECSDIVGDRSDLTPARSSGAKTVGSQACSRVIDWMSNEKMHITLVALGGKYDVCTQIEGYEEIPERNMPKALSIFGRRDNSGQQTLRVDKSKPIFKPVHMTPPQLAELQSFLMVQALGRLPKQYNYRPSANFSSVQADQKASVGNASAPASSPPGKDAWLSDDDAWHYAKRVALAAAIAAGGGWFF